MNYRISIWNNVFEMHIPACQTPDHASCFCGGGTIRRIFPQSGRTMTLSCLPGPQSFVQLFFVSEVALALAREVVPRCSFFFFGRELTVPEMENWKVEHNGVII